MQEGFSLTTEIPLFGKRNGLSARKRATESAKCRDGLHACRRYMHYTSVARAPSSVQSRDYWRPRNRGSTKIISICVAVCSPAGQRLPHGPAGGSEVDGVIFVMCPKRPRTCLPLGAEKSSSLHTTSAHRGTHADCTPDRHRRPRGLLHREDQNSQPNTLWIAPRGGSVAENALRAISTRRLLTRNDSR